ncbi:NAD(P)H-hydrate dehydratase [Amphibacillus cookii]|uniref:NAD(P)H-hydrate dehydratase n=1 Tax=Amphibacillus cookii TaxID=767787 RepID=UPI001956BF36|nr:NAD(P)H-hydrate dehydratase [Amphibacillus cookii]MBM7542897.1 NAD(P)H-hydrate epimerase [Amphibacillus cookii]
MNSVTAEEMYEIDRKAVEDYRIPGELLMENAGRAIVNQLFDQLFLEMKIVVLVGSGNNGGDGFVVARTLLNCGYHVDVVQTVANDRIKGDAAKHKDRLLCFDCPIHIVDDQQAYQAIIDEADLVVDAMLGIGFKGPLTDPYRKLINQINQGEAKVVAIDLPSGVPAQSDAFDPFAVQADVTICIEAPKPSAFIEKYAGYYGAWKVVEIGIPKALITASSKQVWTLDKVNKTLPKRAKHGHKGSYGKGLVIGGSKEMPGSVRLTAKAALRGGSGLVTVATSKEALPIIANDLTEATFEQCPVENDVSETDVQGLADRFDALVIGMGMGRSEQTSQLIQAMVKTNKPLIIDADGLYFVKDLLDDLKKRSSPTILTPHPGEMAMLLNQTIEDVKADPFQIAEKFSKRYQVYLVLKGPYTIITDPFGCQIINTSGNPGLAKGGSGDCLAGIILAQLMQKQSLLNGLANACYIHGLAADIAINERHSTMDLLATDIIDYLPQAFRTCLA